MLDEKDASARTVRAVWTPDLTDTPAGGSALAPPVGYEQRKQLVRLSSELALTYPNLPGAIKVENLMLSALGAWADLRGQWTPSEGLSITDWENRTTLGRDHYVKLVKVGYLLPFGHLAAWVEITEARAHAAGSRRGAARHRVTPTRARRLRRVVRIRR